LANILNGYRGCSERSRIDICKKIGGDYCSLIDTGNNRASISEPQSKYSGPERRNLVLQFPQNNEANLSPEELIRLDMHQRLDDILKSGHVVLISAIQSNLVAFSESVKDKKDKQDMLDRIKILEGKSG
jgi:hypothetical protein